MNRDSFQKIYNSLKKIIAPRLLYSQTVYEQYLVQNVQEDTVWLELGCGTQTLPRWRRNAEEELIARAKKVVGIDYDAPSLARNSSIKLKVRGNITRLPFPDNTFDLITSNMVFEHLDDPLKQLKEVTRVLKMNGKLIFHTPNSWGYTTICAKLLPNAIKDKIVYFIDGRIEEDVFQTYYKINSKYTIHKYADEAKLKVESIRLICSSAQLIIFPPLVFLELIWIRFLMTKLGRPLRTNIIATLEKI